MSDDIQMNRRNFLASIGLAPLALAQTPRPNIVILLADDLGWADPGFHGSEIRTPSLDRLAAQSLEIRRFYSCPVCSPTRSALMTGRVPMRLGTGYTVIRPWEEFGISTQEHFMPETFQAAGYETAMAGKWHLGHSRKAYLPGARGFKHSYGHVNGAIDYNTHIRDGGLDWHRNGARLEEPGYSTDLIGAEAVRRIKQRDKSKPLFLYVPFNAPHSPLQAPDAVAARYASIKDGKRRMFAAMVDVMDTNIGRILDALDQEGIAGNTIVFFFSDNGGPTDFGARNTPLRGAKASTWEGGLRVPALLRWTGRIKPGKTSQVGAAIDLFPTLAAAAGIKPGNKLPLDGMNLWPMLSTGKTVPREDLFFSVESGNVYRLALHHGPWKLVREIAVDGSRDQSHLFRIEEDPNETNDVAAAHPAVVKDLNQRLDRWRKLSPANGMRHSGRPPAGWKPPAQYTEAAASGG
ncbi:MAG: arylsulfatase [Acidobacteria bacterium]|nr:arylsulfatase [Acidobacteriota bacterium]